MKDKKVGLMGFLCSVLLVSIVVGQTNTKEKSPAALPDVEKDIYQWFKTYSEVVSIVEKKAFRGVDFSKFIQNSLKTAASEIDAHSSFLTPDTYKAAMES